MSVYNDDCLLGHRWFIRELDPIEQAANPNCPPSILKKVAKAYEKKKLKELKEKIVIYIYRELNLSLRIYVH